MTTKFKLTRKQRKRGIVRVNLFLSAEQYYKLWAVSKKENLRHTSMAKKILMERIDFIYENISSQSNFDIPGTEQMNLFDK